MIEVYEVVAVARTEALCLMVLISFFAVLVVWLVNGWLVVKRCDDVVRENHENPNCENPSFFQVKLKCAAALLCVHGIRRYTDGTNLETGTHNEVATYLIHTGSI